MMKLILLSVIVPLFILSQSLKAQTLAWAFPDSGIVWCQSMSFGVPPDVTGGTERQIFPVNKDTVINGVKYRQLLHTGYSYNSVPGSQTYYFTNEYFGAFRNDTLNEDVEFFNIYGDSIIYKFDLNVGDTIESFPPSFGIIKLVIDSVNTVWMGGIQRRIYYYGTWTTGYLIEGVGLYTGLGEHAYIGDLSYGAHLYCVTLGDSAFNVLSSNLPFYDEAFCNFPCSFVVGTQDIPNGNSVTLYPNPASDKLIVKLSHPSQHVTLQLRNVYGQLLYSEELSETENENTINISSLSVGSYFAILKTDSGSKVKNLMIIR